MRYSSSFFTFWNGGFYHMLWNQVTFSSSRSSKVSDSYLVLTSLKSWKRSKVLSKYIQEVYGFSNSFINKLDLVFIEYLVNNRILLSVSREFDRWKIVLFQLYIIEDICAEIVTHIRFNYDRKVIPEPFISAFLL